MSSAGNGGESASEGAKGEWGRVSFGVGCETVAVVVCFLFLGRGGQASGLGVLSSAGNGGESASGLGELSSAGNGGESASGGAKGNGGESALELGVVAVCFPFLGGGGQVSFRGCEGGMGASQLWGWVLLLSAFFFWGAGGESASGLGVLSSAGNGGESASTRPL